MKRLISALNIVFFLLSIPQLGNAQADTYIKRLEGENLAVSKFMTVEDGWYNCMQTDANYQDIFAIKQTIGRVALQYTGAENKFFSSQWSLKVTYNVIGYGADGEELFDRDDVLFLSFDAQNSTNATGLDVAVKDYPNVHRMIVSIEDVERIGAIDGTLPLANDFSLEAYIEVERYFLLDTEEVIQADHTVYTFQNQVEIFWPFIAGAVEYELQYVHVSDQLTTESGLTTDDLKDFENATRVFVSEQYYKIPRTYESGTLYYRVRAIGRHGDNFQYRQLGAWSQEGNIPIPIGSSFEVARNWTSQTTYAEFSKRSDVVSYFDGIGQSRQAITVDNTTNVPVIAESMLDYEGRPAVSVMPTPLVGDVGNLLGFHPNFSALNGFQPFDKRAFDEDWNRTDPIPLHVASTNAGSFYSPANLLVATANPVANYGMNQNIADAGGFAYTRTLYDDWGRVAEQSGVGPDHKLGSGHTTKYFYSTVDQVKLDRLFGIEAGYAEHYRSKAVQDANGQLSVSYENLSGQVVATAYVGNAPYISTAATMVDGIVSTNSPEDASENFIGSTTVNLHSHNQYSSSDGTWRIVRPMFVGSTGPRTFNYNLNLATAQFNGTEAPCGQGDECEYELDIRIIDQNGDEMTFSVNPLSGTPQTLDTPPSDITTTFSSTTFPVLVKYSQAYHLRFEVPFSTVGTYTIVKELRLHNATEAAYAYLAAITANPNLCGYEALVSTPCITDIETITDNSQNPLQTSEDCEGLKDAFIADLSPGGQYYDNINLSNLATPNNDWLLVSSPRNVPSPSTLYDGLEDALDLLEVPDITTPTSLEHDITTETEFWSAIRTYFEYPAVEEFFTENVMADNGLALWKYHPEYPHYAWCADIATIETTNTAFHTSLKNYDADADISGWVDDLESSTTSALCTADMAGLLNADPYFTTSSTLGSRKVNATMTGRQLMEKYLCEYPVKYTDPISGLVTDIPMWSHAKNIADYNNTIQPYIQADYTLPPTFNPTGPYDWDDPNDPNDTFNPFPDDIVEASPQQIWDEFVKLYNSKKAEVIRLQKINPCSNTHYSPFLFDLSTEESTVDFIADCPRQQADYFWGEHPYCVGSNPSADIHVFYTDWDNGCTETDPTTTGLYIKAASLWTGNNTISTACEISGCTQDNELLYLNDHRAIGFQIRVPDVQQNVMDAAEPGISDDGVFGQGDNFDNFVNNTNGNIDPCRPVFQFPYPDPSLVYEGPFSDKLILGFTGGDYQYLSLLDGPLYFCDNCAGTGVRIDDGPACTNLVVDGTYLSFGDFFDNNAAYFKCLADRINTPVTSPDFEAFYESGAFVIRPVNASQVLEGTVITTSSSCEDCARQTGTGGGCVTVETSDPDPICIVPSSPCPFTPSHCLCEHYDVVHGVNPGNELAMYRAGFGEDNPSLEALITQDFLELLIHECPTIQDPNASVLERNASIALIEAEAEAIETAAMSLVGHKIGIACHVTTPDPCEETGYIQDFYNELELEGNLYQQSQAWLNGFQTACLAPGNLNETFTVEYYDLEYDFTLYYYTPDGNLYATVPPEGVTPLPNTSTILDDIEDKRNREEVTPTDYINLVPLHRRSTLMDNQLMTIYEYDSYNSVVKTTVPDHKDVTETSGTIVYGATYYLYDDLGRIRFSKNPKQAHDDRVSYTKYDGLGRSIESGEMAWDDEEFTDLLNHVNDISFPSTNSTIIEEYVRSIYDAPAGIADVTNDFDGEQNFLRNRIASTLYYEINGVLSHATHYDYSVRGDVATAWQHDPSILDPKGRIKRFDYDFGLVDGLVYAMHYQKGQLDALSHFYDYDANGRLTRTSTASDDGFIEDRDSRMVYRYDGVLGREEIGHYKVQGIDYGYTIHGWIKGINSSVLNHVKDMGLDGNGTAPTHAHVAHKWVARDALGYSLHYYEKDHQPIKTIELADRFYAGLYDAADPTSADGIFSNFSAPADKPVSSMYNGNIAAMQTGIMPTDGATMELIARGYRYDQKMRITKAYTSMVGILPGNLWSSQHNTAKYESTYAYDKNGNLKTLTRNGDGTSPIDNLSYNYLTNTPDGTNARIVRNRLRSVADNSGNAAGLPTGQALDNYTYDNIGNLTADAQEQIQQVKWLVTGKVKEVVHTSSSTYPDVEYRYDSQGNRIEKITKYRDAGSGLQPQRNWLSTLYVRTPQGEVIATYDRKYIPMANTPANPSRMSNKLVGNDAAVAMLDEDFVQHSGTTPTLPTTATGISVLPAVDIEATPTGNQLAEAILLTQHHLYGSRRLGYKSYEDYKKVIHLAQFSVTGTNSSTGKFIGIQPSSTELSVVPAYRYQHRRLGRKHYELTNHLGNVLAVVTDRKEGVDANSDGNVDYYAADVVMATDYYPFGMEMPGRKLNSNPAYRYGFNGKENDRNEWGAQLIQDYGFRLYNPAVGKFLSVDPLAPEFPWNSTYAFAENDVIRSVDLDGLEKIFSIDGEELGQVGNSTEIRVLNSHKYENTVKMKINSPHGLDPQLLTNVLENSNVAYESRDQAAVAFAYKYQSLTHQNDREYGIRLFEHEATGGQTLVVAGSEVRGFKADEYGAAVDLSQSTAPKGFENWEQAGAAHTHPGTGYDFDSEQFSKDDPKFGKFGTADETEATKWGGLYLATPRGVLKYLDYKGAKERIIPVKIPSADGQNGLPSLQRITVPPIKELGTFQKSEIIITPNYPIPKIPLDPKSTKPKRP